MAITDAKTVIGLPVGAKRIRKSDGSAPTVRYAPVGPSLLTNGGFETDVTGWSVLNGTIVRDTGTVKVGTGSLRIDRGTYGDAAEQEITAYPGVYYAISGWVRVGSATSVSVYYDFQNSTGGSVASGYAIQNYTGSTFRYFSALIQAPAGTASLNIQLHLDGSAGQTAFYDALTVLPCVPLVETLYTEPSATGTFAGGSYAYDPTPETHFLGDVQVFDMGAQTDGSLAASSYTRVYGVRHSFVGDLLLDNGVTRLRVAKGYAAGAAVRFSVYVNGAWDTFRDVSPDTGGDSTARVTGFNVASFSRGAVAVDALDADGNVTRFTMRRGIPLVRADTTRAVAVSAWQDYQTATGIRFGVYNAGSVLLDDVISGSLATVAGSSLTEPYALTFQEDDYFLGVLAFTRKPNTLGFSNVAGEHVRWRDTGATVAPFLRSFFFGALPFPWLTSGAVFKEAESATLAGGATSVAEGGTSGGSKAQLDAQNEETSYTFVAGRDLPLGDYVLVARAKDTAAVASDFGMRVRSDTDASDLVLTTKTLTASYAYYTAEFSLAAASDGDTVSVRFRKETATANTISADYFLIVPKKRNAGTPAHVHFPYDVARNALMVPVTRENVRRVI